MSDHDMEYRAGLSGFGGRDTGPGWRCSCGGWSFRAQAMPRRKAGNNLIEALRSHAAHKAAFLD